MIDGVDSVTDTNFLLTSLALPQSQDVSIDPQEAARSESRYQSARPQEEQRWPGSQASADGKTTRAETAASQKAQVRSSAGPARHPESPIKGAFFFFKRGVRIIQYGASIR